MFSYPLPHQGSLLVDMLVAMVAVAVLLTLSLTVGATAGIVYETLGCAALLVALHRTAENDATAASSGTAEQ